MVLKFINVSLLLNNINLLLGIDLKLSCKYIKQKKMIEMLDIQICEFI